jgi:hypothetical protein
MVFPHIFHRRLGCFLADLGLFVWAGIAARVATGQDKRRAKPNNQGHNNGAQAHCPDSLHDGPPFLGGRKQLAEPRLEASHKHVRTPSGLEDRRESWHKEFRFAIPWRTAARTGATTHATQKPRKQKAGVVEHPRMRDHTGLLFNGTPSIAGLPFVQSSDSFFTRLNLEFTKVSTDGLIIRLAREKANGL